MRFADAVRTWAGRIRRRPKVGIDLIGYRPLHGGAMLYVADVDAHRLVFIAASHAACLLASYPLSEQPHERQEAVSTPV